MLEAVQVFGNPENVSKIIYRTSSEGGPTDTEYNGFTVLIGVDAVQNLQGVTRVSLRRKYVGE
jgi:hypothetical protein